MKDSNATLIFIYIYIYYFTSNHIHMRAAQITTTVILARKIFPTCQHAPGLSGFWHARFAQTPRD